MSPSQQPRASRSRGSGARSSRLPRASKISGRAGERAGRALLSTSTAVTPQLMNNSLYKLMYNIRALRITHNCPYHNRPLCNPRNGYIMYEGVSQGGSIFFGDQYSLEKK